jgi:hypothetical protein
MLAVTASGRGHMPRRWRGHIALGWGTLLSAGLGRPRPPTPDAEAAGVKAALKRATQGFATSPGHWWLPAQPPSVGERPPLDAQDLQKPLHW